MPGVLLFLMDEKRQRKLPWWLSSKRAPIILTWCVPCLLFYYSFDPLFRKCLSRFVSFGELRQGVWQHPGGRLPIPSLDPHTLHAHSREPFQMNNADLVCCSFNSCIGYCPISCSTILSVQAHPTARHQSGTGQATSNVQLDSAAGS